MPLPLLVPALLSGASFLGGLFGNKRKPQVTTTNTSPTLDPAFKGIQDVLVKNITDRLNRPSSLPPGTAARNIYDINNTYKNVNQSLDNNLTARGLATSPIAGAGHRYLEGNRASDVVQMRQNLPLQERELQNQDLAQALALISLGRGTTGTETVTGGGAGGLGNGISGLASMLGFLTGSGAFGRGAPTPLTNTAPWMGYYPGNVSHLM